MRYLVILLSFAFLFSCSNPRKTFVIVKVVELGGDKISDAALTDLLYEEKNIHVRLEFSSSADETVERLASKEIDLAILPNNTQVSNEASEIRTITPLLPRILMVFYRNEIKPSINQLIESTNLIYELTGASDSIFWKAFTEHYAIDRNSFHYKRFDGTLEYPAIKSQLDSADIFITIGHLNNYLVDSLFSYGYHLFPLDEMQVGNSIEGFSLVYPQAYPFLIPEYVFGGKPIHPLPTLGIRDVLVCHEDFAESRVYDIVEVLSEKRTLLMQRNRNYNLLPYLDQESYHLTFPLHQGSLDYIHKDKPGFLERYADVMALFLSITVLSVGYLVSILRKEKTEDTSDE